MNESFEVNAIVRDVNLHLQEMKVCGVPDPEQTFMKAMADCSPAICFSPVSREDLLVGLASLPASSRKFTLDLIVPDIHNVIVVGKGGITDEVVLEHELGHYREGHVTSRLGKSDPVTVEMEADRHAAYTWGLTETIKAIMHVIKVTCKARKACGSEWDDLIEGNLFRLRSLGACEKEISDYFKDI